MSKDTLREQDELAELLEVLEGPYGWKADFDRLLAERDERIKEEATAAERERWISASMARLQTYDAIGVLPSQQARREALEQLSQNTKDFPGWKINKSPNPTSLEEKR